MQTELLNLGVTVIITIFYLIAAMKLILPVFKSISNPLTGASGILYAGTILGFGISLKSFSAAATGALHYYCSSDLMFKGIMFWLLFAGISFVFSYILFRLSFALVGLSTSENERAELAKNNYTIAIVHIIIYNMICLIASDGLVNLANTLVEYPKFPN